jgi:dUTP pyrophosphatase
MIVEYAVIRPEAVHPDRANPSDAGLDVFFNPENGLSIALCPGDNATLPTALKFGIPHGYMLQVCNRSSMGAKRSLIVGAHIIDSGYEGEVFIDLHNIGNYDQTIYPGDKIAQLVMVPVVSFRVSECDSEELYEERITISDRGDGSLGSTDKKTELVEHPLNGQVSGF